MARAILVLMYGQTDRPTNLVLEAPCRSLKMRKWSYLRPEVKNEKNKGTLFSSALKVGENWKKYFSYKLKQIYMYISFTFKIPRFAFSNTKDSLCSKVSCWITLFLWVMIQSTKKEYRFQKCTTFDKYIKKIMLSKGSRFWH